MIPKELLPHFRALSLLGVLLLIGDTALSAQFGYTMGWDMAFIVAGISLASGIFPVVAIFFHRVGWKPLAYGVAAIWVPVFAFNVWSNMGVSVANRLGEVQNAGLLQTTYNERKKAVVESEAKLAMFSKQLDSLIEQQPWVPTVTADSLRQQVKDLESEITEEGSPKNGGCKRLCLQLKEKKRDVENKIGAAEQRVSLTEQIEATKRVLETARAELAGTDGGISVGINQSTGHANLVNADLGGTPDARSIAIANEMNGIAVAFILALAAMGTTLAGAFPALMRVGKININTREVTLDGYQPENEPRAMTETRRDLTEVMDGIKAKGTEIVAAGRDVIRETVKFDDGLRDSIQRRLDEINTRPRRRFA